MKTKFWRSLLTLTSLVAISQTAIWQANTVANAQTYQPSNRTPVADNTLGTQVSGNGNNFNITGGVNRGQTLFHSFSDFSVPTKGQANFTNPVGNRDIITRVTGTVFSDINGLVNTNGANFFLINPNGIVFGTGAQLNVGKAFVGSTANGIDLVDAGGRTITFGTNSNSDAPLLSIAPNVLFDVSRLNMGGGTGAISNFGTLQTSNNNQYIGLIGGNITLDGGKIIAPGGRVDIGGLNGAGSVSIERNGLVFSNNGLGRSNVLLTNDAGITVRATGTLATVNTFFNNVTAPGSSINISGNNLDILNSGSIVSNTLPAALDAGLETNLGVQTIAAGDINIDATGKVNLNSSNIKNTLRSGAEGTTGGVKIQAGTLDLNNSSISTAIGGKGNAGNIDIKTTGDINLTNQSILISDNLLPTAQGNAGDINVTANGNIKISGAEVSSTNSTSYISSDTYGQGDTGQIAINTQGKLSVVNKGNISNVVHNTAVGNGKGIRIAARELELANQSYISTITSQNTQVNGKGNAGDINIKTTGDIQVSGYDASSSTTPTLSYISSDTRGYGDTGKVTIDSQGKLSILNYGNISSDIARSAVGNSKGIEIAARAIKITNGFITTGSLPDSQGNSGNIKLKTTGDIQIAGYDLSSTPPKLDLLSFIRSSTSGQGDAGKITIDTQGKLSILNNATIASTVDPAAVGNSQGINITARELEVTNNSDIFTNTFQSVRVDGKGNGGDIAIKATGDIKLAGYDLANPPSTPVSSQISSSTSGSGNAGKITIDTQGKLSILNNGRINSAISANAVGNSKGISIAARELALANGSNIYTGVAPEGKGDAGDITIKATGNIKIAGSDSPSTNPTSSNIFSTTFGKGDAGKITIDTQGSLALVDRGTINGAIGKTAVGNSRGINITAKKVTLANGSSISTSTFQTTPVTGKGNAGDIQIKTTGDLNIAGYDPSSANPVKNVSFIDSNSTGSGKAGDVSIVADRAFFNYAGILSDANSTSGGNVTLSINNLFLMQNGSFVTTNSGSSERNGNGGNITISSPLIIALPGDNNITANAFQGTGGRVDITSQGIFGIQYRPIGSEFTNDITASSEFGQSGTVNVDTPGTDPGRDTTELPNTTTDASNQISQVCSADNRQNKLTVAGRGGLPPNANDPLTSDVVWQDARATSSQPAVSSAPTPSKFAPPAVGWVFDGKGKVTLVAAGTQGQPTGTRVVCPQEVK